MHARSSPSLLLANFREIPCSIIEGHVEPREHSAPIAAAAGRCVATEPRRCSAIATAAVSNELCAIFHYRFFAPIYLVLVQVVRSERVYARSASALSRSSRSWSCHRKNQLSCRSRTFQLHKLLHSLCDCGWPRIRAQERVSVLLVSLSSQHASKAWVPDHTQGEGVCRGMQMSVRLRHPQSGRVRISCLRSVAPRCSSHPEPCECFSSMFSAINKVQRGEMHGVLVTF